VICLHGSASSPRQWHPLGERLSPRFRVVAPGLIGYTDGPPWSEPGPLTLSEEAAWIERWLDAAAAPVHLVGHSYGGAVALKVAQRRPERVRSLALYEPVLFHLLTGEARAEIAALEAQIAAACEAGNAAAAARVFVNYWSGADAWQRMPPAQQGAVTQRMHKVVAEFKAVFGERVDASAYTRLRMPILVLSGTQTCMPAARVAQLAQAIIPAGRCIEMSGLGHLGPVTHPDEVNALIVRFLDAHRDESRVRRLDELPQVA
jgi:pimeloyl-ACP methyl ester carboxylesterase